MISFINTSTVTIFKSIFIYLEEERERSSFQLVHSPNACNCQSWARQNAKSQGPQPGLPHGWQGPRHLSHHLLPPGLHSLVGSWTRKSNQSSNQTLSYRCRSVEQSLKPMQNNTDFSRNLCSCIL